MTIFNCFLKIVYKNKSMIIIYVIIFIIIMFLTMNRLSSSDTSTQYTDNQLPITIIDRNNSTLSVALTDYLGKRHNIIDLDDDVDVLQDALFFRNVEYILYIPEGFEEKFIFNSDDAVIENVKLPDSFSGVYIDNQINHYLSTINAYLTSGFELVDAISYTTMDLQFDTEVLITVSYEDDILFASTFYQFFPFVILSVVVFALCPALMSINNKDILQRMESSSMKLWVKNLQITLGCIIPSIIIWLIFIGIYFLINNKAIFSSVTFLRILNSFVLLLVGISIAYFTGLFAKNQVTLSAVNNIINMGMGFLCGVFVPQDLLSQSVLTVSKFLPVYWYIKNNSLLNEIDINPSYGESYSIGLVIQLGFAIAIFLVAIVVGRQKKFNPQT